MPLRRFLCLPVLAALLGPLAAQAPEPPNPVRERYTKREVLIPMRDGVRLFTSIYLPKDTSRPHPILLQRTPYGVGPYGEEAYRRGVGPSPAFADQDYIVAYQDVRGRFMSEGTFVDARPAKAAADPKATDEATDTYDTIDWLVKHLPDNNGKVGMWGISYPGHYTVQGMLCGHPALKAVSPQAPMIDLWEGDDSYHRGAFQLAANFGFFLFFHSRHETPSPDQPEITDVGTPDGYRWYLDAGPVAGLEGQVKQAPEGIWEEYLRHTTYDAYWQARNLRPRLRDVKPAVLTVGGWYDAEDLFGALACARTLTEKSPATDSHLVMGPWTHGQWASGNGSRIGTAEFGSKTAEWFEREVELPFFNHYLEDTSAPALPKATVFETGRNRWRTFDAWPPKQAKSRNFYLEARGRLSFAKPGTDDGFDSFVSDPAKPVPYTQAVSFDYWAPYMVEDQRFAARRPDVLVYETEPLKEDLTLAGPLRPVLQVSTTGTDSDWIVKIIDVFPDNAPDPAPCPPGWHAAGQQMLVRGDAIRGKFRNSYTTPEPFVPGKPTEVAFTLPDVFHTFRKGHRLMVQIQCSWFPLVDRNPQVFCDIPHAKPSDFRKAEQRVFHSAGLPSRIEAEVLE